MDGAGDDDYPAVTGMTEADFIKAMKAYDKAASAGQRALTAPSTLVISAWPRRLSPAQYSA